jgi:SDR family mycofactocin-dependent oxidoreductase
MGKLEEKVAFVTGAARGQGRAHCLTLAGEGADIAVLDICRDLDYPHYSLGTRAQLDEVVAEVKKLGRRAIGLVADVREKMDVKSAVEGTLAEFGHIDILVNNAAVAGMLPFWEITEAQWDAMLDTNLKGCWLTAKYVAPHMIAQRSGKIVNISSVAGAKGWANLAHYTAAKHGLIGLTRTMAIELAPYHINVNAVLPGTVASPMLNGLAEELGLTSEDIQTTFLPSHLFQEVIQPQDIADAVLWLVSEQARFVTGAAIPVDAGWLTK